ncbi:MULTISPECIES: methyl-accepting chemotaxis protein [unclassified Paraburkholderia]|uniref:methyl-accepting chemotaxis protein n=1 Tax=unclassified Paraburkholderia TaxID=2615204 RepID=UPI00197EEC3C|nr:MULTISPECIES: methyl-accepting chemotaxis protein [unclassified Paraburkholderia]MBN3857038.1 HAMP domain-containing protein [Paraburkholderia sp. Ac-20340]
MNGLLQTVRFKIIAAMATCVVIIALIGAFSASTISGLNQTVLDEYSGTVVPIRDLGDVRASAIDARLQLTRIAMNRDAAQTRTAAQAVDRDLAQMSKAWTDYYPARVSGADERAIADKIDAAMAPFRDGSNQSMQRYNAGDYDGGLQLEKDHTALAQNLQDLLNQDIAINDDEAQAFAAGSEHHAHVALMVAVALVLAGLAVAFAASVFLLRVIMRPLNGAITVANTIAGGCLESEIDASAGGEFGELLRALKRMDGQLAGIVRGIQDSTESVALAAREIAAGNLDLSARTEEQAASLEETAASMTEITETVKQNADNARAANGLAGNANELASGGDSAVQEMVGTIRQISGSSHKISEITGVIEGIAFQTNILALNAAVEAARAGEQGRGFAVVASEVRSLAQRSATAAREIKELINSSVTMIEGGAQQAGRVSDTMGQVREAIKRVSDIVAEISSASEEQSKGIEQVSQAVTQMDEVTQQNAALVEQAAAAAQSLEQQADTLKRAVGVFSFAQAARQAFAGAPHGQPGQRLQPSLG